VTLELDVAGFTHAPVTGFVWHSERARGSDTPPVSTVAVISPGAPTFTLATAKALGLLVSGITRIPKVASARATMSGVGVLEAVRSSVLTPGMTGAGSVFVQSKLKWSSVAANGWLGVTEIRKLCPGRPLPGTPRMSTGVLGVPNGTFRKVVGW
jgi:hypothetical protein